MQTDAFGVDADFQELIAAHPKLADGGQRRPER